MARINPEHKKTLLSTGRWAEFVMYRDTLKAEGVKPAEANKRAIAEFLGEEAVATRASNFSLEKSSASTAEADRPAPRQKSPVQQKAKMQETADVVEAIPLRRFGGREAGGNEIIMWVARNMDIQDVKPKDCPDPAAWTYLMQCRNNALFKQNFLLQLGMRALLKQEDDTSGKDAVAVKLVDTIDKLLELRSTSEAEGKSHDLEDAGSNPASAPKGGA